MKGWQKFNVGFLVCLVFTLCGIAGHSVSCQAEYWGDAMNRVISVSVSAIKQTEVKLAFSQAEAGKINQIRLFRKKKGGEWKKIATLKGNAQSYKDQIKFDTHYTYKAVAYRKRGKKYKKLDFHTCPVYAGVAAVLWYGDSDELYGHPMTTPESVSIHAEVALYREDNEFLPSGYEIYKSIDNKNFECIKASDTIADLYDIRYVDTDVQSGQTYYYKLRGSLQYKNKTYYSYFSTTQTCIAANSIGVYSVKVLTERGKELPALDVCLTSEEGNADLTFLNIGRFPKEYGYLGCFAGNDVVSSSQLIYVLITQYSTDGVNWFPIEEDSMVLKPGQVLYLRFERADGMAFDLTEERAEIYDIPISCYPDWNILWIDFLKQEVQIHAYFD